MPSDLFRTVALALRSHISDTYSLIEATDAVLAVVPTYSAPAAAAPSTTYHGHESYVEVALNNPVVLGYLVASRKINAIKALRTATGCGLRDAKDAVEDYRVVDHAAVIRSTSQEPKPTY